MMARTGAFEIFANSAFTACASSTLLVVSTMMTPLVADDQGHVGHRVANGHVHPVRHLDDVLAELLLAVCAKPLAPGEFLRGGHWTRRHQHRQSPPQRVAQSFVSTGLHVHSSAERIELRSR